jgi:hypothetical protein
VGCDTEDGFYPADSTSGVLPTSTSQGADDEDPYDNDRITVNTAACGDCHQTDEARAHMEQNGGAYDACLLPDGTVYRKIDECGISEPMGEVLQETCTVCHGPGRSADTGVVHGL